MLDLTLFATSPTCATTPSVACIDAGGHGVAETLLVPNTTAAPITVFVIVKSYYASSATWPALGYPGPPRLALAVEGP